MSDWKNSPIIAVVVAGATVLTTTLYIVFTYALPVYQKEDKNKIIELQNIIKEKDALIEKITSEKDGEIDKKDNEITMQVKKYEKELSEVIEKNHSIFQRNEELEKNIREITVGSLFQKGGYLPIGFDAIEPGGYRYSIFKYYGLPKVIANNKYSYLTVNYGRAGIDHVVYYFSDNNKNVISHISVFKEISLSNAHEDSDKDSVSFKKLLLSSLGYIEPCKDSYYIWKIKNKNLFVYYDDSEGYSYQIYSDRTYPSQFNKECALNMLNRNDSN